MPAFQLTLELPHFRTPELPPLARISFKNAVLQLNGRAAAPAEPFQLFYVDGNLPQRRERAQAEFLKKFRVASQFMTPKPKRFGERDGCKPGRGTDSNSNFAGPHCSSSGVPAALSGISRGEDAASTNQPILPSQN